MCCFQLSRSFSCRQCIFMMFHSFWQPASSLLWQVGQLSRQKTTELLLNVLQERNTFPFLFIFFSLYDKMVLNRCIIECNAVVCVPSHNLILQGSRRHSFHVWRGSTTMCNPCYFTSFFVVVFQFFDNVILSGAKKSTQLGVAFPSFLVICLYFAF